MLPDESGKKKKKTRYDDNFLNGIGQTVIKLLTECDSDWFTVLVNLKVQNS